jgi:hypothetical protein
VPALVGTALFIIRMILMLFGGDHDVGHDVGDTDIAHDSAGAFKALSLQTFTAFAMGFGWGGVFGLYTLHLDTGRSILAGVIAGAGMVWVLAALLRSVGQLQSSGNVRLETVVGCEGEVYVNVPPKGQGTGQVRVVTGERMRIINAQSEGDSVPSQSRVRVVRANGDNTVTVTPV